MENNKGCGKEIDFITGEGIVMHTERCGEICKYLGDEGLILCNECKEKQNGN